MTRERKHIGVEIRWMCRKDLREVMEIERLCFPDYPWSETDVVQFLRGDTGIGSVAEVDGEIVGYMFYRLLLKSLHLESIAVHPKYRRGGIGYAMIDRLIGKLSPSRRRSIATEVWETNLAAQLFLRAMGFTCVRVVRSPYDDVDDDSYLFRYSIDDPQPTTYPINRFRGLLGDDDAN